MLAHGAVLCHNGVDLAQLKAILSDFHQAGLEQAEVDMMDLAYNLSSKPHAVTQAEIEKLRADGFSDVEILDITLAAAARNFYARIFDTLGVMPDQELMDQEPELWEFVRSLPG